MSTPSLATAGGALLDIGYAGQPADLEECSTFTLSNESTTGGLESAGTIDFGIAVARGDTAACCKIISSDAHLPIGITVRHPVMVNAAAGTLGYRTSQPVPIMYQGDIYAKAYETVAAGDQVISVTAQGGKLSGTAAGLVGSGRVLLPGAHWVNAVTAGSVGLIRLIGVNNPNTTS